MYNGHSEDKLQWKLFSEKFALTKQNQYDGSKNGAAWRVTTGNYFVSRIPDIDNILKLIEENEDVPFTVSNIVGALQHQIQEHLIQAMASELRWYFKLNWRDSARRTFSNAQNLEGFEAWRKLTKPITNISEIRRIEPTPKIQRPDQAQTLAEVSTSLEKRDTDTRKHLEAGGHPQSFEEKKSCALFDPRQHSQAWNIPEGV